MIKNKKNIFRHAAEDNVFPNISPAKNNIPRWYMDTPKFKNGEFPNRLPAEVTFKACAPFLSSLTSGYMLPLPVDIMVEQTEGGPVITWRDPDVNFLALRDDNHNILLPVPEGFSKLHFAWNTKHCFNIPKGYSALVTHPLNRFDLPFITLSGFIDGNFSVPSGNVPVFFSKTFEGLIPAGTPIAQIIPFKTENWESVYDKNVLEEAFLNHKKSGFSSWGWYRDNIWKKPKFD